MQQNKAELLYPELSYSIIGAAMDVHNELGPGLDEWDYHQSMIESLRIKGHQAVSHDRQNLIHRDFTVDLFELDIIVDKLIILELKHIKTGFHSKHYTQTLNYLKRWEKRLGVLVNFGLERLAYKRIPYDPVNGTISYSGKWDELIKMVPQHGKHIEKVMGAIMEKHGYGYGVSVFQKLIMAELTYLGSTAVHPQLSPTFGKLELGTREINSILVDSELLVSVSATGQNASSVDLAYLKSYMKHLGIACGILVDIGSANVQLKGVL